MTQCFKDEPYLIQEINFSFYSTQKTSLDIFGVLVEVIIHTFM